MNKYLRDLLSLILEIFQAIKLERELWGASITSDPLYVRLLDVIKRIEKQLAPLPGNRRRDGTKQLVFEFYDSRL